MKLESIVSNITDSLSKMKTQDSAYTPVTVVDKNQVISEHTKDLEASLQVRVLSEFSAAGPLEALLADTDITEIIVNDHNTIWFEKKGVFYKHQDCFLSEVTYTNFIHLLGAEASIQTHYKMPFCNGEWRSFRVHLASPPITSTHTLTLRRLKPYSIRLEDLSQKGWCSQKDLALLKNLVADKKNILVVGSTGSGKTTLLNSMILQAENDRCVYIEDTAELVLNNNLSTRLLTRVDANGVLPDIDQTDLVKQSLRMRPDRLVLGEIRGTEAKDLLMALSTGHGGSMASIHAGSAQEALMRLEMLVLMGAPEWNLTTIRRLIHLTVHAIVVTGKHKDHWKLDGVYKISSLESFGFLIDTMELMD